MASRIHMLKPKLCPSIQGNLWTFLHSTSEQAGRVVSCNQWYVLRTQLLLQSPRCPRARISIRNSYRKKNILMCKVTHIEASTLWLKFPAEMLKTNSTHDSSKPW
jgi:hypothetical protein